MQRLVTAAFAVLVVTATVASVAAVGASSPATTATAEERAQSEGYAGSHVAFETSGSAVTNYSVDGTELFASAETQSQSEYESQPGVDVGLSLSAVTDVAGAAVSLDASTKTRAEVSSESGATITAHDSRRGILTVQSGEEAQYTEFELSSESDVSTDGDDRVVVESGDRIGAFVVAGDGDVTVNEDGNVVADLDGNSTLVFRSYEGERDDADREQERLVADGVATAEVYVEERDGDRVADVATYGQDLAIETGSEAEGEVNMTVERATSEGTVVIASVSESAIATAESADDVDVTVDGEAAVAASSYSELEAGIGEEPRYLVRKSSEASASVDVLVTIDHFSERDVTMEPAEGSGSGDGDTSGDGDGAAEDSPPATDDGNEEDGTPGFGAVGAIIALLGAIGLRLR